MVNLFETVFFSSFTVSSGRFNKIYAESVILLQIKVFSGKINETTLARYSIKVVAHLSFLRLTVISEEIAFTIKMENKNLFVYPPDEFRF